MTSSEVTVWMAFSKFCEVELTIYRGLPVTHNGPGPLFATSTPDIARSPSTRTLYLGTALHIVAVTVAVPLQPGQPYSYSVSFRHAQGTDDLRTQGYLGGSTTGHKPLGQTSGVLPSFIASPAAAQLRIAHGSCRKLGGDGKDALPRLMEGIGDSSTRPHRLLLSGDQIYSDDVPFPISPSLTAIGKALRVDPATTTDETMPVRKWNAAPVHYPLDQNHFPAHHRHKLTDQMFTSTAASCHLFGFGEMAATYLLAWSPSLWKFVPLHATLAGFQAEFRAILVNQRDNVLSPAEPESWPSAADYEKEQKRLVAYRDGVADVEVVLANTPTYMLFDDHEVTDDWNRTLAWQKNAYLEDGERQGAAGRTIVRNALAAYSAFQDLGNQPADYALGSAKWNALAEIAKSHTGVFDRDLLDATYGIGVQKQPQVRWDFFVEGGPDVDIAFLDTRTRRTFRGEKSPPVLIDAAELAKQLPDLRLRSSPDHVLLVVSPGNVALDMGQRELTEPLPEFLVDDNVKDLESWDEDVLATAALFDALASRRKVVFLTGDVHHGYSTIIDYYRKGSRWRAAQLVSSSLRNRPVELAETAPQRRGLRRLYAKYDHQYGLVWSQHVRVLLDLKHAGPYWFGRHDRKMSTGPRDSLAGFAEPDAYWHSEHAGNPAVATDPATPMAKLRRRVTPRTHWDTHVGIVTFTDTSVTQTLLCAPGENLATLTVTIPYGAPPEPFYGWPP